MNIHPRPRAAGFTLVELIITITIMVLLAALVVGGFGFVREKQARDTARLQIQLLSLGIDEYKLDMGVYPGHGNSSDFGGDASSSDGDNSEVLYNALFHEGWEFIKDRPADWASDKAMKIYVSQLDPGNNNQGWLNRTTSPRPPSDLKIIDPWGNNYRYRVGSNAMNPDFDLWSAGKDGRTEPGSSGGAYDPNNADNRDDIRNF